MDFGPPKMGRQMETRLLSGIFVYLFAFWALVILPLSPKIKDLFPQGLLSSRGEIDKRIHGDVLEVTLQHAVCAFKVCLCLAWTTWLSINSGVLFVGAIRIRAYYLGSISGPLIFGNSHVRCTRASSCNCPERPGTRAVITLVHGRTPAARLLREGNRPESDSRFDCSMESENPCCAGSFVRPRRVVFPGMEYFHPPLVSDSNMRSSLSLKATSA